MIRDIVETFRKPSAEILAQREYEDMKRSLLDAERMQAYYTKMTEFYRGRLNQLERSWKTETLSTSSSTSFVLEQRS